MNFYDVLAAEKWGGGIPTINFFDLLFAQSISGEKWQVYEGTLPATISANGADMRQYQVYGATGGVGDRTVQLFDKNATDVNNGFVFGAYLNDDNSQTLYSQMAISEFISITPGQSYFLRYRLKTLSYNVPSFCFYDSNKEFISGEKYNNINNLTFTSPQNAHYIRFTFQLAFYELVVLCLATDIPEGDVTPYGYKLDMSVSDGTTSTTIPIYIGDEPLWAVNTYADCADYQKQKVTSAIKKYVLTGDENWEIITGAYASRTYFRWVFAPINYCVRHVCTSSHFEQASITTATTTVGFDVFDSTSVNGEVLAIRPANVQSTTLTDFKAWLAEQYAAGTPVTVWCALTTAEETDPPVPLPALPTCEGTTVIDYAGQSVAPEKVYFEYQGGKQP